MRLQPLVERGKAVRPFVPIDWRFPCPIHGEHEVAEAVALADTGAPAAMLSEGALPAGHVSWDDLPANGGKLPSLMGGLEWRWWEVELRAFYVPISTRIKVYRGAYPDFPIVGTDDFFRAFRVSFDWGSNPPSFDVEPYAHGLLMAPGDRPGDFMPLEDVPLVRYADQHYRANPGGFAIVAGASPQPVPALNAQPADHSSESGGSSTNNDHR